VLQGLGVAFVLLAGQAWLAGQGWSAGQGRGVVFSALVLAVMLLILANRDPSRPVLLGAAASNPWLWRMAAGVAALLVAVLGLPWLRELMGLALPGARELTLAAVLVALCLVWLELLRVLGPRWGRARRGS
jgi:Ca2+-transporting ATPase